MSSPIKPTSGAPSTPAPEQTDQIAISDCPTIKIEDPDLLDAVYTDRSIHMPIDAKFCPEETITFKKPDTFDTADKSLQRLHLQFAIVAEGLTPENQIAIDTMASSSSLKKREIHITGLADKNHPYSRFNGNLPLAIQRAILVDQELRQAYTAKGKNADDLNISHSLNIESTPGIRGASIMIAK